MARLFVSPACGTKVVLAAYWINLWLSPHLKLSSLLGRVLQELFDRPRPPDGQDDLVGVDVLEGLLGNLVGAAFQLGGELLQRLEKLPLEVRDDLGVVLLGLAAGSRDDVVQGVDGVPFL